MINLTKRLEAKHFRSIEKQLTAAWSSSTQDNHAPDEFKALNLYKVKGQELAKRIPRKTPVFAPRATQMAVDQDWGSVWPGPRSFHPATVPLPVRQGYTEKGAPPPDKYANAELMKIPNFLHLTPPVIKRQCEALKQFCTPWPSALDMAEKIDRHFPLEITTSDYCHSSPSIRDPLARIVTLRFKLQSLKLDERAKDKFLRLLGDRYSKDTDTVTLVTDRCPLRKQNLDYAMYLLTALYHESRKVESWEELKTEADMEHYVWENNASKQAVEGIFGVKAEEIPHVVTYSQAVTDYLNEGENDYTVSKYSVAVRELLSLPSIGPTNQPGS